MNPIDQAIIASQGDAAARKALEKRLVDALAGGISRSAQDYVCRKLRVVGTGQSVEALAALLPAEETSHIARYALERIGDEKATQAMRDVLPKVSGKLKPGMIGAGHASRHQEHRGHREASRRLRLQVARAAAHSLGLIGTPAAAKELSKFAKKRLPT